jgi:hypothetical protein
MIAYLICFFVIIGALIIFEKKSRVARARNDNKTAQVEVKKSAVRTRAEQFSFIGWQVVKAYEELPDTYRPSFDIESAVRALDFKCNIDAVNNHFPYHEVRNGVSRIICPCISGRSNGRSYQNDRPRHDKCQRFSEYTDLYDEMYAIKREITSQAKALEAQERAVKLAGMRSDLDSVKSITEALRQERSLISDTTSEIRSQTRSIS